MAERQIGHRKSSLVLSARVSDVKWRSRSVAKSVYSCFYRNQKYISNDTLEKYTLKDILNMYFDIEDE